AALRLAEHYLTLERDAPPVPEVDIAGLVREALDEDRAASGGGGGLGGAGASAISTVSHLWRRQLGRARRVAGEVILWGADPRRPVDLAARAVATVGDVRSQVGQGGSLPGGSPLWRKRSRHRHFDVLRVPLPSMSATAKTLGGSINDVFVTGAVLGAIRFHQQRETPLEALNISFVVSTRDSGGAEAGGGAVRRHPRPPRRGPRRCEWRGRHGQRGRDRQSAADLGGHRGG